MTYGEQFRAVRRSLGKGIRQLAVDIGINRSFLSDVERGKRLPFVVSRSLDVARQMGADPLPLMFSAARARGIDPAAISRLDDQTLTAVLQAIMADDG